MAFKCVFNTNERKKLHLCPFERETERAREMNKRWAIIHKNALYFDRHVECSIFPAPETDANGLLSKVRTIKETK